MYLPTLIKFIEIYDLQSNPAYLPLAGQGGRGVEEMFSQALDTITAADVKGGIKHCGYKL
ncbi:MAG: hypothetical protein LBI79_02810 [Nitrososphaerota archaeon]|jgi:hypothetical protein|nr:hypothetical protein [Nitrososphaerota archaeon]